MTILPLSAIVVFFFVLLFSAPTLAEIKSITISDDFRPIIFFEKFRFTLTGHVTVSVSSVSVSSPSYSPVPDSSRLGFFFLTEESIPQIILELQQNPIFCVLDSRHILNLFTFRDQIQSYSITSPNYYSLFFANCVPETKVSMKLKTEMYNLDPNGSKVYLQPGLTQLPGLYLFFSLSYFIFFTLWVYLCFNNNNKRTYILMAALLLVKSLSLMCAFEVKHNVKVTGISHGWNVLFCIFRFIGVVLLFTVIVLIGTGWWFLKPKLQEKEEKKNKLLVMIVILFLVLASIATIVIEETGPFIEYWVTWNQILLLADMIFCCAVAWLICRREKSKTDGRAVKKLPRFRRFYSLVIVYLLFTRIVGFLLKVNVGYEYQWVSNAAEEIASLAFCILMFYMFRAMERNVYFGVNEEHEEEEDTRELALKKE